MAEIKPFQGIIYNQERIQNLSSVIAPPYDVISDEAREKLYQNSEYNIIRLIKGKTESQDCATSNQYTRAHLFLKSWLKEEILQKDHEPCIYIMEDEYTIPDSTMKLVRKGFTALIKLEEFGSGKILPHEKTLSKPKEDRLKLIQACKTNLSPIFAFYSDPSYITNDLFNEAKSETKPFIDIVSQERVVHRVWRAVNRRIIQGIIEEMGPKPVLIADGHHRYETALNFCRQMCSSLPASAAATREECSYVMMYFSNMDDPGLTILPYHRLLKISENFQSWKSVAQQCFRVERFSFDGIITTEGQARERMFFHLSEKGRNAVPAYGLYMGDKNYYLLSLEPGIDLDREIPGSLPFVCKQLDVTILDHLFVNRILGQNAIENKEAYLGFSHDPNEAVRAVNSDEYQMALFLNPTPIQMVSKIASIGLKMPQKSTFFYPKLPTGLVLRKITED
ncbi:MAG: DUF1015 domain-containing protein [bacterium]